MAYSEGGLEEDLRAQADTGAGATERMSRSESDDRSDAGDSARRDGQVVANQELPDRDRQPGHEGETGAGGGRDGDDRASRKEVSPSQDVSMAGGNKATSQRTSTTGSRGFDTTDSSTDYRSTIGGPADAGGQPQSFRQTLLSFIGWIFGRDATTDEERDDGYRETSASDRLRYLAKEGYDLHQPYCNQSVSHVTEGFGITELTGMPANEQVAYMQQNWSKVDGRTAQALANNGSLAIAGLAAPDQGHTAIATPGAGAIKPDGNFYPNVTCGGPPDGRSDGSRTAGDVWTPSDRGKVEYFVPRQE